MKTKMSKIKGEVKRKRIKYYNPGKSPIKVGSIVNLRYFDNIRVKITGVAWAGSDMGSGWGIRIEAIKCETCGRCQPNDIDGKWIDASHAFPPNVLSRVKPECNCYYAHNMPHGTHVTSCPNFNQIYVRYRR